MKNISALLILLASCTTALAQGQVNFLNTSTTLVSTNSWESGPATGLTFSPAIEQYWFALFKAPAGTTDRNAFVFTGFYGTNTLPGRFNGGAGSAGAPALAGEPIGSTISLLIRAWNDDAFGKNWNVVSAWVESGFSPSLSGTLPTWYGESQIATVILGGGATPIPGMFGTGAGQIPGFMLSTIIPEPSALSLLITGAGSIWMWGRQSRKNIL